MDRKKIIKDHFESEAKRFDQLVIKHVPFYQESLDALVLSLPFKKNQSIKVLDLGCGTGTVALLVNKRFPKAVITCQDLAGNMLEMAGEKLKKYKKVKYLQGDFLKIDLGKNYDAIVSSLALHHIGTGRQKKDFYRKLYQALKPGGVFVNSDIIISSDEDIEKIYMLKWREFLLRIHNSHDLVRLVKKYHTEDRPASLPDHLKWLDQAGFKSTDVIWKDNKFAVYWARR